MSASGSADSIVSDPVPRRSSRATRRQIFASFSAGLACLAVGSCLGWPSPIQRRLGDKHWRWPGHRAGPPHPLSQFELSWMVSLMDLGIVLGSLPAGWAADRWGRRSVLLMSAPIFVVSWLLVLLAQGPEYLYVARLLQGLASAVAMVVSAMYVGEVSEDGLRGANSALVATLTALGTVLAYAVGPFATYRTLACSLLAPPALFVLCFCWAPESPYWLLERGRRVEAEQALRYLRAAGHCQLRVHAEADRIETSILEQAAAAEQAPASGWLVASARRHAASARELLLVAGPDRNAFALLMALVCLQALSGSDPMTTYSPVTLPGGFVIPIDQVVIIFGVVSTVFTGLGMLLIDCVGRRPLLLVSSSLQAVALLGSAAYYTLEKRSDVDLTNAAWLPPLGLVLFGVAYPAGLGCVPNALQMELFSTRVKALALPAILISFNVLTFTVSLLYPTLCNLLGKDVVFWIFTGDSFLAVFVTAFVLKETKGKSFQEIQDLLCPRRKQRLTPTWPS